MTKKFTLTIGADPEFFVVDAKKRVVSAHTFCTGTKDMPMPVAHGCSVQVDGLALEIGIPACSTNYEFNAAVQRAIAGVRKMVPKDFDFSFSPTVYFDKEYYDKEVPAEAKVLGCNPDRDAYKDGDFNPVPDIITTPKGVMRTGAGHLHFGWTNGADVNNPDHIQDCIQLVKNLDVVFGVVSPFWDKDEERRKMYGRPGAFRVKPYGCEYRTLSNAWLGVPSLYSPIFSLAMWTFNATAHPDGYKAIDAFRDIKDLDTYEVIATRQIKYLSAFRNYERSLNRVVPECLNVPSVIDGVTAVYLPKLMLSNETPRRTTNDW